jgi:hypothetical protein
VVLPGRFHCSLQYWLSTRQLAGVLREFGCYLGMRCCEEHSASFRDMLLGL